MNVELVRIWKEAIMALSRYCPHTCLETLRKTTEIFSENDFYPCRVSNRTSYVYESRALLVEANPSVIIIEKIILYDILTKSYQDYSSFTA
jgi:hypothetical protein